MTSVREVASSAPTPFAARPPGVLSTLRWTTLPAAYGGRKPEPYFLFGLTTATRLAGNTEGASCRPKQIPVLSIAATGNSLRSDHRSDRPARSLRGPAFRHNRNSRGSPCPVWNLRLASLRRGAAPQIPYCANCFELLRPAGDYGEYTVTPNRSGAYAGSVALPRSFFPVFIENKARPGNRRLEFWSAPRGSGDASRQSLGGMAPRLRITRKPAPSGRSLVWILRGSSPHRSPGRVASW